MSEHPHSPPDATSHISRHDLAPRVASYERNLFNQTRDLLRPYGITFNDADELKPQLKDNTTISIADLHRLHALLLQMNHIRTTGELPPEAQRERGIFTVKDATNPFKEALETGGITDPDLTAEHRDIPVNLPELLAHHAALYEELDLPTWADALRNHTINLTPEARDLLESQIKEGNIPILMPDRATQRATLKDALKNLKPLWIKNYNPQDVADPSIWKYYYDNEAYLDAMVADIPEEPYILLTKPTQNTPPETTFKTLAQQQEDIAKLQETNPNLQSILPQEYASLQALFTRALKDTATNHSLTTLDPLDRYTWTRFISLPVSDGNVPDACFNAGSRQQVGFSSHHVGSYDWCGFRPALRVRI